MSETCSVSAEYSNGPLPMQKSLERHTPLFSDPHNIHCSSSLYMICFNGSYIQIWDFGKNQHGSNQQAQNSEALGKTLQVLPSGSARSAIYLAKVEESTAYSSEVHAAGNESRLKQITYCSFWADAIIFHNPCAALRY